MIQSYSEEEIVFDKELNKLDQFVLSFIKLLGNINYVLVSGYVAIFFGRTRATEDVDFFIEEISFEKFKEFAKKVKSSGYWFINGDNEENLYEILKEGASIRIAIDGRVEPNSEIRFARAHTDTFSLNNRVKVKLGKNVIYMSPLSIQIAYKLYLGTDKDFEDARHLYKLFEKYLDKEDLKIFIKLLNVEKVAEKILWQENFQKK